MNIFSLIREDKLFSTIYISGTAMAITFTMIMAIVYYIKLADIYPEVNRKNTLYLSSINVTQTSNDANGGAGFGIYMDYNNSSYETYCKDIKNVLYMAPSTISGGNGKSAENNTRRVKSKNGVWESAITNLTNQDFFNIYEFEFLSGAPFSAENVENNECTAVITRDFADIIFGKDVNPVGERFTMKSCGDFRVCGVVRSASPLTPDSYAQIYVPYTSISENDSYFVSFSSVVVMVKDDEQLDALKTELDEWSHKMSMEGSPILEAVGSFSSSINAKVETSMTNNMETHAAHMILTDPNSASKGDTLNDRLLYFLGIFVILLFVPALNLCGMVAGRMEKRLPEMGVRKSFGAPRHTLLFQVVKENMIFTIIGGAFGLVVTWMALVLFRNSILELFFDSSLLKNSAMVSGEAMFAPLVFIFAFVSITILNLASATLPAYISLRKPIVESMNDKQ